MRLIALDTATERCSVALWLDGAVRTREAPRAGAASELILCLIEQVLAESGVALSSLEIIAFGRGPGAFTGVRLAAGVAQGLAFAADLPVLPVSDLQALAQQAFKQVGAPARALACQDARMGEVYWGCFDRLGTMARYAGPEAVGAPTSVRLPGAWGGPSWEGKGCCAAGSGFEAHPFLAGLPGIESSWLWSGFRPHALEIAELAAAEGLAAALPPELGLPVYLRDEVATRPSST
jgi:tRNA threonylcarbamoyladenosine biosynthesis protein TsaB